MKIANKVIFMLGPDMTMHGGISSVVQSYAKANFLERHHICYLATHIEGSHWQKLKIAAKAWGILLVALLKQQVLAVHLHTASRVSFWRKSCFIGLAHLFKVPVLLHVHGGDFQKFYGVESGRIQQALIRWILDISSVIIVLSSHWQEWFSQLVDATKVKVVANPVEIVPLVDKKTQSDRPLRLLFMGSLQKRKGIFELLTAFQTLIIKYPDLQLVYGGSGLATQELAAKVQYLGLTGQVFLPGWVTADSKIAAFQAADIFVLPSYTENFPVALLEAMSAALPSVVTCVGGVVDIIQDGENGLLITPRDSDGIVAKVSQLLDSKVQRKLIGEKGRQYVVEHCALESVMTTLEDIYRSLNLVNETIG